MDDFVPHQGRVRPAGQNRRFGGAAQRHIVIDQPHVHARPVIPQIRMIGIGQRIGRKTQRAVAGRGRELNPGIPAVT
jgi:hypothetical protein